MKLLKVLNARNRAFFDHRPAVIACIGDSVTHGCFEVFLNEENKVDTACRASEAYPALLGHELGRLYPFAQPCVLNAGGSGDNAVNGRKRLSRDVLFARPDLVIVNFGLNDSMNPDTEGGLTRYRAAMKGIFDDVRASGAECLLLTPNMMCSYVSRSLENEALRNIAKDAARVQNEGVLTRYVEAAKSAANEANVPVADAYAVWQSLSRAGVDTTAKLSNHINHPDADAHRIFVNEIMRALFTENIPV